MQEIKFRVWDKQEGQMYYGGFYVSPIGEIIWRNEFRQDPKRYILIQFIGLRDKKRTKEFPDGQEMCQGDIVTCPYIFDGARELSKNKFGTVCTVDSDGSQHSIDMLMLEHIEVIGNKWKN